MVFLASSSASRALLLKQAGITYEQIAFDYDESKICAIKTAPVSYSQAVVEQKVWQFKAHFGSQLGQFLERGAIIFADSSVICKGQILGKAKDESHARAMLELQSGAKASVYTAMCVLAKDFTLTALSVASYDFAPYPEREIDKYIASGEYIGKAGAMMIEGFSGRYILSQHGDISTAMGLDVPLLKAFLAPLA